MKKIIITVIILIGIIVLGIQGKGLLEERNHEIANTPTPHSTTVSVPVVTPVTGSLQQESPFLAHVISDQSIALSTKLTGYVESILVHESQPVKQGELLVRIDAAELLSSITALQATQNAQRSDLAQAQSILERNTKLYNIGGLAKEKLDASKLAVTLKRAAVENTTQRIAQLEHQRSYADIRAPFDGIVDTLLLHKGDLAAALKPILRMSNGIKKLRFSYAATPQTVIAKGDRVLLNRESIGTVTTVYTTATNGLTTAEVSLNRPIPFRVGSSVTITVVTDEAKGCILPVTALLHKKEGIFVMRYKENVFTPFKIHVNLQQDDRVIVKPCPQTPVATASEVKLARLPAYDRIRVTGGAHE